MVLHNPNNWHWVDKNCIDWSREYFKEKLVGIKSSDDKSKVEVSQVKSVEGDVDVSQRKGKIISLFDVNILLSFTGEIEGLDDKIAGEIKIPEVAYDSEPEDYTFNISLNSDSFDKEPVKTLVRKELIPQLRKALHLFGTDLIRTHGSDIQHPEEEVKSKFTLANAKQSKQELEEIAAKAAAAKASESSSSSASSKKVVGTAAYNTTTLHLEPSFKAPADQLYLTFLDPARVAAWSRSKPEISAVEGSDYSLFGGNIRGKIIKLQENKSIEMSWRLKEWKEGYFANLKLEFNQGQDDTKVKVTWTGIPVGQEEVAQNNFEEYYVKSIKLTFGFGAVL